MKRVLAGIAAIAAIVVAPGAANAQDDTQITLLHGIPGVTVDVAVGGAVLLPGFEPGAIQDLTAFAGQTLANLEVRLAGDEDVAIGPDRRVRRARIWQLDRRRPPRCRRRADRDAVREQHGDDR